MKKIALLLCLLSSFALMAEPPVRERPNPDSHRPQQGNFIQSLNLTPEQKQSLKQMQTERQQLSAKMQSLTAGRNELNQMIKNPSASESEITAKLNSVNQLFTEINSARIQSLISLRQTLSPQQLSMIISKMEERKVSTNMSESERPGMPHDQAIQNKHKQFGFDNSKPGQNAYQNRANSSKLRNEPKLFRQESRYRK